MSAFLPACIVVICSIVLLIRVHRLDPFASVSMRSFLFPGFRLQRRIAWLSGVCGACLLVGLSLLADFAAAPLWQSVMLVCSVYCSLGLLRLLMRINELGFDKRNADPVFQALKMLVTWPVWKRSA